uniref:Ribosomal protein L20 n=1 Tax=Lithothamnion sp. TaxID=1940749 RepID=A0A3G3MIE7_9FLOR|nr:ribosomal protein L20 [Lithothamnion sp.]
MLVYFLTLKNNKITTLSRKSKKIDLSGFLTKKNNYILFCTSFSYNLLCYFLKNNKINLNKLVLYKIVTEELGSSFSLINWLNSFYNKSY